MDSLPGVIIRKTVTELERDKCVFIELPGLTTTFLNHYCT